METGAPSPESSSASPLARWLPIGLLLLGGLVAYLAIGSSGPAREAQLAALAASDLVVRGEEQAPSLAELVFAEAVAESRAATGDDPEAVSPRAIAVQLGEVRYRGASGDSEIASLSLRRSLALGLRQASDAGLRPLDDSGGLIEDAEPVRLAPQIEGESEPVPGGMSGLLQRTEYGLALELAGARRESPWVPPNRGSLLPPLIAIALAIVTRKPMIALLLGVVSGAMLVATREGATGLTPFTDGAVLSVTRYLKAEITAPDRLQIVIFVVLMLAMVGNLTRNGGIRGIMLRLRKLAKGPRTTQVSTVVMGFAVFFDDYANTVLVGSTMRPLTDRMRIAREKLAYLVDSTAAPVAGISIFSTWIAFEVSTFSAQLPVAGLTPADGYDVFLQTLPYRFYCFGTLAMVMMIAITGRDFGPMRRAERRARTTGALLAPGAQPMVGAKATALDAAEGVEPQAWRAVLPLLAFIGTTLFEIARRGGAFDPELDLFTLTGLTQVLGKGSGNWPLMIGSVVGFGVAALATLSAGLGPKEVLHAAWTTLRSMGVALAILYLAWMVGAVCQDLATASFLSVSIGDQLHPALLPAVLVGLAAFVAFSTGSSWGTMSILLPLVVGLSYQLGEGLPIGPTMLMILCIGAVLEGAIFGDHCSPISDTTVLSSISCASDHIDHVRTQAPYALVVMGLSLGLGYLPAAFLGWEPWLCWSLVLASLVGVVFLLGRPAPLVSSTEQP